MTSDTQVSFVASEDEISPFAATNAVLRNRRFIVKMAFWFGLGTGLLVMAPPRHYTAIAVFSPQAQSGLSQLAGMAAQFGVTLPDPGAGARTPDFYAALVRSPNIMNGIVDGQYDLEAHGRWFEMGRTKHFQGSLIQIMEVDEASHQFAHEITMELLLDNVGVSTSPETGLVTVTVTTEWSELSQAIAQRILEGVDSVNRVLRSNDASAERQFTETRLVGLTQELRSSEHTMEGFLQRNRTYQSSPTLVFEYNRLQADLLLKQQLVQSLTKALEQARIEEVRNTPVITVVQGPEALVRPDRRRLVLKGLIGAILGGIIGSAIALMRELASKRSPTRQAELAELTRLREEVVGDIRRLLRRPAR